MWCQVNGYYAHAANLGLKSRKIVPMCRLKGRQSNTRFQDLLLYEMSVK